RLVAVTSKFPLPVLFHNDKAIVGKTERTVRESPFSGHDIFDVLGIRLWSINLDCTHCLAQEIRRKILYILCDHTVTRHTIINAILGCRNVERVNIRSGQGPSLNPGIQSVLEKEQQTGGYSSLYILNHLNRYRCVCPVKVKRCTRALERNIPTTIISSNCNNPCRSIGNRESGDQAQCTRCNRDRL